MHAHLEYSKSYASIFGQPYSRIKRAYMTILFSQASDPYREHFSTGEAWRLEHPEFEPKLCFYAFDTAVEHVEVRRSRNSASFNIPNELNSCPAPPTNSTE